MLTGQSGLHLTWINELCSGDLEVRAMKLSTCVLSAVGADPRVNHLQERALVVGAANDFAYLHQVSVQSDDAGMAHN